MTALLTVDEAAALQVGVNVIVRPGERMRYHRVEGAPFVAPQDWVALTGPCPTCDGTRIVPLYTACDNRDWIGGTDKVCSKCGGGGRVLAGRGSIEVVPVIDGESPCPGVPHITVLRQPGDVLIGLCDGAGNAPMIEQDFDPLPIPGRDFGIVIVCVEVGR